MSRAKGATGSLLLHLALLALLVPISCAPPPAPAAAPPPPTETTVEIKLLPVGGEDGPACDNFYTGIGVAGWPMISYVAPGGPADLAGARAGDTFVNHYDFGADLYPLGTRRVLVYQRDTEVFRRFVTISKICRT